MYDGFFWYLTANSATRRAVDAQCPSISPQSCFLLVCAKTAETFRSWRVRLSVRFRELRGWENDFSWRLARSAEGGMFSFPTADMLFVRAMLTTRPHNNRTIAQASQLGYTMSIVDILRDQSYRIYYSLQSLYTPPEPPFPHESSAE